MSRDLSASTVVITGASSGIGRAAALKFARCGSRLVLAARGRDALEDCGEECCAAGARVLVVPTDVRDEDAVHALAERAVEAFGSLDVWVNCAGLMAYGRFEDVPSDVFRAVVETNFFGQVHGARASLAIFRRQGSGTLIDMSSVWGRITTPDVSPYVASKFAARSFSEVLYQEMRDVPGIEVATMVPQAVDTPIFQLSANYSGREVRPVPPVLKAEKVAEGIVRCAQDPKREVSYGILGRVLRAVYALTPGLFHRVVPASFLAGNYGSERVPAGPGVVLDSPSGPRAVGGGWRSQPGKLAGAFAAAAVAGIRSLIRGR